MAKSAAFVMFLGSATAFAFLGYSLLNLSRLGIGPLHPRVLVEASLGIVLFVTAFLILAR
jgi:hypothetical protein